MSLPRRPPRNQHYPHQSPRQLQLPLPQQKQPPLRLQLPRRRQQRLPQRTPRLRLRPPLLRPQRLLHRHHQTPQRPPLQLRPPHRKLHRPPKLHPQKNQRQLRQLDRLVPHQRQQRLQPPWPKPLRRPLPPKQPLRSRPERTQLHLHRHPLLQRRLQQLQRPRHQNFQNLRLRPHRLQSRRPKPRLCHLHRNNRPQRIRYLRHPRRLLNRPIPALFPLHRRKLKRRNNYNQGHWR